MRTEVNKTNVTVVFWYGNTVALSAARDPGTLRFLLNAAAIGGLRNKATQEIVGSLAVGAEGSYQRTITPDLAQTYTQGNNLTLSYYATVGGKASTLGLNNDPTRVVRCDNQTLVNNGTGCVISSHTPTIYWNESNSPAVWENIRTAIAAGKPSRLNRTSSALADTNRGAACSPARQAALGPKPAGYECDEYPFASTTQGGATSQIMFVPGEENGFQSRWINTFYQVNRIMQGDAYDVATV